MIRLVWLCRTISSFGNLTSGFGRGGGGDPTSDCEPDFIAADIFYFLFSFFFLNYFSNFRFDIRFPIAVVPLLSTSISTILLHIRTSGSKSICHPFFALMWFQIIVRVQFTIFHHFWCVTSIFVQLLLFTLFGSGSKVQKCVGYINRSISRRRLPDGGSDARWRRHHRVRPQPQERGGA